MRRTPRPTSPSRRFSPACPSTGSGRYPGDRRSPGSGSNAIEAERVPATVGDRGAPFAPLLFAVLLPRSAGDDVILHGACGVQLLWSHYCEP
jgi:hypothetical protein